MILTGNFIISVVPSADTSIDESRRPQTSSEQSSTITCGMDISPSQGNSGLITSPNYPSSYLPNSDCSWNVVNNDPDALTLSLSLDDMDIETDGSRECPYDKLTVRQAGVDRVLCGQNNGTIDVLSSTVQIVFTSDNLMEGSGFKIRYDFIPN